MGTLRCEVFLGVPLGRGKLLGSREQHAIVVAANAQHVALNQEIGCSCWIERTGQVISQIHDLLDASAINILQDRFQAQRFP